MSNQPFTRTRIDGSSPTAEWFDTLVAEAAHLDQLGVKSAMVSMHLLANGDPRRAASQARTLFGLTLRPTDRVEQTSSLSFSLLLSPQENLVETVMLTNSIAAKFRKADIRVLSGYAHRRPGESLVTTWARAEAELDCLLYRRERAKGITLS